MTVFILGSGATRGASFVKKSGVVKPPLDRDFFTQLQRISEKKYQKTVEDVIDDATTILGPSFNTTLEGFFSSVEHTHKMASVVALGNKKRGSKRKLFLSAVKNDLLHGISAVFECSMLDKSSLALKSHECTYHRKLVQMLRRKDTILSFNYDCLIDETLKRTGSTVWNPMYGYGLHPGQNKEVSDFNGYQDWKPWSKNKVGVSETVFLLKLHGSLHFKMKKNSGGKHHVELKKDPYTKRHGYQEMSIIPPESVKSYDKGVYSRLWKMAYRKLEQTDSIVFVGYSLPPTDLHATALFRLGTQATDLKSLTVVNPDQAARARTREIMRHAIGYRTRVLSFDTIEEFVSAPESLWR